MQAKLQFDDARGHYCPACNHRFNVSTRALPNMAAPQPDDIGLCIYCGALFKHVQDGLLLKLVLTDESQLSAEQLRDLSTARKKQTELKRLADKLDRLFRRNIF